MSTGVVELWRKFKNTEEKEEAIEAIFKSGLSNEQQAMLALEAFKEETTENEFDVRGKAKTFGLKFKNDVHLEAISFLEERNDSIFPDLTAPYIYDIGLEHRDAASDAISSLGKIALKYHQESGESVSDKLREMRKIAGYIVDLAKNSPISSVHAINTLKDFPNDVGASGIGDIIADRDAAEKTVLYGISVLKDMPGEKAIVILLSSQILNGQRYTLERLEALVNMTTYPESPEEKFPYRSLIMSVNALTDELCNPKKLLEEADTEEKFSRLTQAFKDGNGHGYLKDENYENALEIVKGTEAASKAYWARRVELQTEEIAPTA